MRAVIAAALLALGLSRPVPAQEALPQPSTQELKSLLTLNQIVYEAAGDGTVRPVCHMGLPLTAAEIPDHAENALVAIEDARFRDHRGIDPIALSRAMFKTLSGSLQGGSTLTQQLAKNLLLSGSRRIDKRVERKLRELPWAIAIEEALTKEEILTAYFNRVAFGYEAGRPIVGIEQAARVYYGRHAKDLSLHEAAVLAGMVQAPDLYNPKRNREGAHARAKTVLAAMVKNALLSQKAMDEALARKPRKRGPVQPVKVECRYFVDLVEAELASLKPAVPREAGLRVFISLDTVKQYWAERAVLTFLTRMEPRHVGEGALIAMTPRGRVLALVGGRHYSSNQFNRAIHAKRQPASAFKPAVFLSALEAGLKRATRLRHGSFAGATCSYKEAHSDPKQLTLEQALAESSNSVAMHLADRVGVARIVETAARLGITSKLRPDCALALGASEVSLAELTASYAPFANGGKRAAAHGVLAVVRDGQFVYVRKEAASVQATSPERAAAMRKMLRLAVAGGTGRPANAVAGAAGKTGTSQKNRDAWFVGFTDKLVTGLWFGNDDSSAMAGVTGTDAAGAWANFNANVRGK